MKIIFMGTPEFAVPVLQAISKQHQVVAVYTQAPKPAGRGHKETYSPIHLKALELETPVFHPKSLRNEASKNEFLSLNADCLVVMAYGLILPKEVLEHCKYGAINLHPSLLPKFRGAAPMQRTILAGEKETAMCIMQMDEGIDTGDILAQEKMFLDEKITYSELSNKMSKLGARMILDTLDNIDHITPIKQIGESCYAEKIKKEEGLLNWQENAVNLNRKVRTLSTWPGTYFMLGDEKIKVLESNFDEEQHNFLPGTIVDKAILSFACSKGIFYPLIIQRAGKKPMPVKEFLKGFKL